MLLTPKERLPQVQDGREGGRFDRKGRVCDANEARRRLRVAGRRLVRGQRHRQPVTNDLIPQVE